jgi:hypothetical protein
MIIVIQPPMSRCHFSLLSGEEMPRVHPSRVLRSTAKTDMDWYHRFRLYLGGSGRSHNIESYLSSLVEYEIPRQWTRDL